MTNIHIFNTPTELTTKYFKVGCWYQGLGTESGIIAKFEAIESNHGWWGSSIPLAEKVEGDKLGTFVRNYFRLVTPELWVEITDEKLVNQLNQKL